MCAVALEQRTDLDVRVAELEARLEPGLRPLAAVAFNYRWSWLEGGPEVFEAIDPHRWRRSGDNPVRFLSDLTRERQRRAERDPSVLERVEWLAAAVTQTLAPVPRADEQLIVFLCSEFGVHASLPTYSGGLGVLAGDILKEASDMGLPFVGIGLFYRRGYFCQRLDLSGWQVEYWLDYDPEELPMALVLDRDGSPLRLAIRVFDRELAFHVWRVGVGRVTLLLLDADLPENDLVQRWTSGWLYDAQPRIRLAQYALLGIGGARLLAELGIDPAVIHLNEGHPALAPLELAARAVSQGADATATLEGLRPRIVFTTHTPVPAGNERYPRDLFLEAYGDLARRLGIDDDAFVSLCSVQPDDPEGPGLSPLAMRIAGRRNGVSRLHGQVARAMWKPMFPEGEAPIEHVTNGVHRPSFLSEPLRRLFSRHLGSAWLERPASPEAWAAVREIPNEELWAARCQARERLVDYAREKAAQDRLLRGEELSYVLATYEALRPDALTLGFARRLARYKRLDLLVHDAERALRILTGPQPVQLVIAGKAHPRDEDGKRLLQRFYALRRATSARDLAVVFLENYDLSVARHLVAGCDVWLNLPRRPLEASGTSGMKACLNGVLQLSVLDGWWAEAYNGRNGWAIAGDDGNGDPALSDARDAEELYGLVEDQVIPLFYDRDEAGVPQGWCELIKEMLATCAPAFSATRMLDEYVNRVYPPRASG